MGYGMKNKAKNMIKAFWNLGFKDVFRLFKKGGINLVLFELVYKLVPLVFIYPLVIWGMNMTLKKAGFRYLTNDYFFTYLSSPYTIIYFVSIIVFAGVYIIYEIACLSVCFDAGCHHKKISLQEIYGKGWHLLLSMLKLKKIHTVFYMIFLPIVLNNTIFTIILSGITLPDSTKRNIEEHIIFVYLGIVLYGLIFVYFIFHMFAINFMTYEGKDIRESKSRSRALIKKRELKSIVIIILWNLMILIGIYILYFVVIGLVSVGVFFLNQTDMGLAIFLSIFRIVIVVVQALLVTISIPLSYAMITSMFYRFRIQSNDEALFGRISECKWRDRKYSLVNKKVVSFVIIIALFINIFYLVYSFDSNPFSKVEIFSETEIMAHRGSSFDVPENTMMAFEKAVSETADYIELDVHESKDGQVVVLHDTSLKRTTGLDEYIWDVDYDDIKDLDAGSYFGDDELFLDCRIPTLQEVMEYTKGKIKLNIEIKQTNYEPELVKLVYDLIVEYEYEEDCVVTSMSYDALKEMKSYDENIQTGYILSVAYGNFYNISDVDAFSISSAFVNKTLVDAIHNQGKEIYVWTVNTKEMSKKLTIMGVDGLITDDPVMVKEIVYSKYSNTLMDNVLCYVFN